MRLAIFSAFPIRAGHRGPCRLPVVVLGLIWLLGSADDAPAQATDGPIAADDLRLVSLTETEVDLPFSALLHNDIADRIAANVELERAPLHGQLMESSDGFIYMPEDTFWAVGSDQLTYRLEVGSETAYATVHLAARRFPLGPINAIAFDDPAETFLLQRPGLSFETDAPIKGAGSLSVRATETGGTSYFSVDLDPEGGPTVGPVATDNGNTDFCLGGLPDPPSAFGYLGVSTEGPAGYVLLIGSKHADIDDAIVRVGLQDDYNGLFLEVKEVLADGTEIWHRTKTLVHRSDTLRIQVSFDIEGDQLAALLRFDGLALRSPVVPFHGSHPESTHLGYFLPPSGGTAHNLVFDAIQVAIEDEAPGEGPGLVGPLLMADGLKADGSTAWAGSYGTGLQESVAPLTGDQGFELHNVSGVSFSSYQAPSGETVEQLSLRARIDTSALSIEEGRRLAIINIQSDSHPLFGLPEHELRLTEIAGEIIASLRFHHGDDVWSGLSWSLLEGEHVVRIQIGRSDSPRIDNGWMRLWIDGEIAQELFDVPNDGLDLRTVHLGAKHFLTDMVSGSIRFDEVTVTK